MSNKQASEHQQGVRLRQLHDGRSRPRAALRAARLRMEAVGRQPQVRQHRRRAHPGTNLASSWLPGYHHIV